MKTNEKNSDTLSVGICYEKVYFSGSVRSMRIFARVLAVRWLKATNSLRY